MIYAREIAVAKIARNEDCATGFLRQFLGDNAAGETGAQIGEAVIECNSLLIQIKENIAWLEILKQCRHNGSKAKMVRIKNVLAGILAITMLGCLGASAQAQTKHFPGWHGWTQIGERNVSDRVDRDTIISWGHTRHRHLRLCVSRHAVRFYDVAVIFFGDGHQNVRVRSLILAGQCTRAIKLIGGVRDIAMVKLVYEATSLGHKSATIHVYAKR